MSNIPFNSTIIIMSLLLVSCGGADEVGGDSQSPNNAPVLEKIGDQYTTRNTAKIITLSATDPDSDVVTFDASCQNSNVSVTLTSNKLILTPASAWNGTATITVVVSDGSLNDSDSFTFTALEVSKPPTISSSNSLSTPPNIPEF